MDFMWAWRLGIPQLKWYLYKHRNDPIEDTNEEQA